MREYANMDRTSHLCPNSLDGNPELLDLEAKDNMPSFVSETKSCAEEEMEIRAR
jgi:hypothetical protein